MDRHGDAGPHQHLGRRQDAAGAKRHAQNRPHLLRHLQPDGGAGFLPDTRAVPDQTEKAQVELQAVLPQQVCTFGR